MSGNKATFNIKPDAGYMVLSVAPAVFDGLPIQADGTINTEDINGHKNHMAEALKQKLFVHDPQSNQNINGELVLVNASVSAHPPKADQIILFVRFPWADKVPKTLILRYLLWQNRNGETVEIKVYEGDWVDKYWLTPQQPSLSLRPQPLETLARFIRLGMDHIAEGTDHWLFLILILIVHFSWRRWLYVMSAFTLAHALTYSWIMLGYGVAPSVWVETAIAATIVWGAVSVLVAPLRQFASPTLTMPPMLPRPPRLINEVIVVFVFGLVHGAGFATAAGESGVSARYLGLSVLGFNLGIELGQLAIALMLVVIVFLEKPLYQIGWQAAYTKSVKTSVALIGLLIGLYWLWARWGQ